MHIVNNLFIYSCSIKLVSRITCHSIKRKLHKHVETCPLKQLYVLFNICLETLDSSPLSFLVMSGFKMTFRESLPDNYSIRLTE